MQHVQKKLGVVESLYKYEVACCYEDVVKWLYKGVVTYLYKYNNDYFDVDFHLAHPFE